MHMGLTEVRTYGQVVAVKTAAGRILGFHSNNLEVAELSEDAWNQVADIASPETGDVLTELKNWNQSVNPLVVKDRPSKDLNTVTINVTQICNLACSYCAAGGDGTYGDPVKRISVDRTIPQLSVLMNRARKGGDFRLNFLGGEPLLYPDGIRILSDVASELAAKKGLNVQFSIVTNGTQFSESNIELLRSLNAGITISLDGNPETNDKRRPSKGGRGVTQEISQGVRRLLELRGSLKSIGFSGVFGPGNLNLEDAWSFYRGFGVDWYDFTFDHIASDATTSAEFSKALRDLAFRAYQLGGEKEVRKIRTFDRFFERLDSQHQLENFCGAGKTYLAIDARNQLAPCHWMIGEENLRIGSNTTVLEERLLPFAAPLIDQNSCSSCWAKYMCGGGCMFIHRNKTGDLHEVDSNFCLRMKSDLVTTFELYLMCRNVTSQETDNELL